ncbi:hypothetical protein Ahy_B06g083771 [Arachis hypogaea]|uniref:BPL/LPL catalytic domain-containing protein n=1 Tax=Arachis hypogaea TaxID=3818 RepID=A0A444YQJ2_ARAHY|nr:hypothetical protein Ahy_B06g083771 [Arachis hypogaea]
MQRHQLELPYSLINTNTCKLFSKSTFNNTASFNIILSFSIVAPINWNVNKADCMINKFVSQQGMRVLRSLEVLKLGVVNYLDALKLQEKLVLDRKSHRIWDTLLSLQHPPTYTVGKRQTVHNLLIPQSELEQIGAELHYT